MAKHIQRGWGSPWSGTPEDLVRVAAEGQEIVVAAAGQGFTCSFTASFKHRRESSYSDADELLAGFKAGDIRELKSIMVLYMDRESDRPDLISSAGVDLVFGFGQRPFVTVQGGEPALVDGLARRLTGLFAGPRLGRQSLRPPGKVSGWMRLRTHAGTVVALLLTAAITAAITVAVTIYVTKLLG